MSKFSVKKPLTIFVAVIAILVLGVVAYFKMTPDLFPNMDFPYVMIVTSYPGASPEKVEAEVTKPLEQSMATLAHIKEVTSSSSENYAMVMLEFDTDVDLDTIGVDIQQNITSLSESWDDMVGSPYILKLNPSMIPVEVAAVSMEGMDTTALSEFVEDTLLGKLEGVAGVARVSLSGSVSQEIHVILDQQKLDAMSKTVEDAINGQMDDAAAELDEKKQELEEAQEKLDSAKTELDSGKSSLAAQTAQGEAAINQKQLDLASTKGAVQSQLTQLNTSKAQVDAALTALLALRDGLQTLDTQTASLQQQLDSLNTLRSALDTASTAKAALDQQIAAIQGDSSLGAEEKQAAIAAIENSMDYQQLQGQLAQLDAALSAAGLDASSLPGSITALENGLQVLAQQRTQLADALAQQQLTESLLDSTISELTANQTQLDAGISQLETTLTQLDSGMVQLQEAMQTLSTQKTNGLLKLGDAAAEITVNSATLSSALTQLDSGLTTLEDSRESALKQADLSKTLTMSTVSSILTAQNFSMPAGYVEQDGISYMVSVGDELTSADELSDLLLFDLGIDGVEPIYLSDVSQVVVTDNSAESYAKLNGLDGLILSFEKQSTTPTAKVTDNIAARFAALEAEYDGLSFVALMDQGDYIHLIVSSILQSLLFGAVFAILVLYLFLKDLRPTFITLCAIPISVIFAIVLMYFSGVTLNMISLSGLAVAVGMLVDNSVVVIENIYRLRAKGANVVQAAVSGAKQVAGAVTASTLTTVCVFLPIVFVEGITKQLFTDLALTMAYALLASLIVSLTLVPAMASSMLRKQKVQKSGLLDRLLVGYRKAAAWTLGHRAIVLLLALALLVGSCVLSLTQGFTYMPNIDMPSVSVSVTMPEDASMEESAALADQVLEKISSLDGIATVGAMMSSGRGMGAMSSGGSHDVTIYITMEKDNALGSMVGKDIEALCADLPCQVTASSSMMDISYLTGSGVSLKIFASDMDTLQNAGKQAASALSGVAGLTKVSDGLEDAADSIHIRIDRNAAMQNGMTVAQIYMSLSAALQDTTTATTLELDGNSTDVIVEQAENARLTLDSLEDYMLSTTTQTGETKEFRLGDVAEIEKTTSLTSISRIDQRRYLTVSAAVEEGYNVTLVASAAEKAMANVDLGSGVSYEFSGENESIMEAINQLGLMLLLGVLLVYLVMVAQFQSLKSPFIVMFTIPLAFTGGFLGLLLCGMEVSVVAMVGFVMLTGVVVNNGIVLVDYINQLRREGMERRDAIIEAGATRMRPILMTSVTTILGLLVMALGQSSGTALMQPVAVVCIGGLLYATLMTLFVVPCMYDLVNKKQLRNVQDEDLLFQDV